MVSSPVFLTTALYLVKAFAEVLCATEQLGFVLNVFVPAIV